MCKVGSKVSHHHTYYVTSSETNWAVRDFVVRLDEVCVCVCVRVCVCVYASAVGSQLGSKVGSKVLHHHTYDVTSYVTPSETNWAVK